MTHTSLRPFRSISQCFSWFREMTRPLTRVIALLSVILLWGVAHAQTAQTITGFSPATPISFTNSQTFTVSATGGGSGNPVVFASTTTAVCTVAGTNGSTVSVLKVGTCTLTANQAGNASFSAAPQVSRNVVINKGNQTVTFAGPANPTQFSATALALTGSASSTLAVAYTSATTSVCTVSGTNMTFVSVGTCTINANQTGNANWNAAAQVQRTFTISKGTQTITFAGPANPTPFSLSTLALTGSVNSSLPITYASTTTGVCTVSGSNMTFVAAGSCTLTANQAGNANWNAATQVSRTFTISKGAQTITFASPGNKVFASGSFVPTTSSTSGLAVTLTSGTTSICTVTAGNTVNLIAVGSCTLNANQAGNANWNSATQVAQTISITKANQTITFGTLMDRAFGSGSFTVSATASSGLAVAFTSGTTSTCTVTGGNTVNLVAGGTCTIRANQAGNTNYNAATQVAQSFTIGKTNQTVTFNALANKTMGAAPFTISASSSSGLAVTFTSTTTPQCTVSGSTVTLVAPGTCTIAANQAGNANYNAAPQVTQSFTISAALIAQAITNFNPVTPVNYSVNGTFMLSATGGASGNPVTFSTTTSAICTVSGATVTMVTPGTCILKADQAGNSTYNAAPTITKNVIINKTPQTITFPSIANREIGTPAFTVTATASSALAVTITSASQQVCTIAGNTVTLVAVGTCTLNANQAGNATFAAAQASRAFLVNAVGATVASLSVGWGHACVVTAAGAVKCWGYNEFGQLGNGMTAVTQNVPVDVVGLTTPVSVVEAGFTHTCVITDTGGVKCWGHNANGQLGDGTTNASLSPVDVVGLSSSAIALALGNGHTCALLSDGEVKCWGDNPFGGGIGDGTGLARLTPTTVTGFGSGAGVKDIRAGGYHTCAVTSGNGIKCWGTNFAGEIGDGTTNTVFEPVDVTAHSSGVFIADGGEAFSCSLGTAGGVKCWGKNDYGQLGNGTTTDSLVPVNVSTLGSGVAGLSVGGYGACAVTPASEVKCWGNLTSSNTPTVITGTAPNIVDIGAGAGSACTLSADGLVQCWGNNNYGQLGNGGTFGGNTPVTVVGLPSSPLNAQTITNFNPVSPVQFAPSTPFTLSATGGGSGNAVIFSSTTTSVCTVSGNSVTMVSVGACILAANQAGGSGYSPAPQITATVQIDKGPQTITFATAADRIIGAAPFNLVATASSGGAVAFTSTTTSVCTVSGTTVTMLVVGVCTIAANQAGTANYLAAPTLTRSFNVQVTNPTAQTITGFAPPSPITFSPGNSFPLSAVGGASGNPVVFGTTSPLVCTVDGNIVTLVAAGTCALTADQAGTPNYLAAPQVTANVIINKGSQFINFEPLSERFLSEGSFTVSALSTSGLDVSFSTTTTSICTVSGTTVTLVAFGQCTINADQAGDNNYNVAATVSQSFAVTGPKSALAITNGFYHSCALTTDGAVKCWGWNELGSLGDGTTALRRTAPVNVVGLNSGITSIKAGFSHTCAITSAGGVKCWGNNYNGQLGDGTYTRRNVPVDVVGLSSGVIAISAGSSHSCALIAGGEVRCWGNFFWGANALLTNVPTAVPGLTQGSGVRGIGSGESESCAITASGGVQCWGAVFQKSEFIPLPNDYGYEANLLTLETTADPIDVPGASSGTVQLSNGYFAGCRRTSAGGVDCWGGNFSYQLGNGTNVYSTTPVTPTGLGTGVISLSTNNAAQSCALTSTSIVKCWGGIVEFSTPSTVSGTAPNLIDVASGNHKCTLSANGRVQCWGYNVYGQTGVGSTDPVYDPTDVIGLTGSGAQSQTITFGALPDRAITAGTFSVSATASSGLSVAFASTTPAVCTVAGTTVTLVTTGYCAIAARQAGNMTFNGAPQVVQTFTVQNANVLAQAITGFNPASPVVYVANGSFPLSATGGASGQPVIFSSTTPGVCVVRGTNARMLATGTCTLAANQASSPAYSAAPTVTANVSITKSPQTITWTSPGNKVMGDPAFPLFAIASSGLVVSFSTTTPSVCTVSGSTATLVSAGTCTLNANQAGNSVYDAAPVAATSITVALGPQSIAFTPPLNKSLGDAPFSLTATSTSGLPVTFSSTTTSVCTLASTTITIVGSGLCTVAANQAGNSAYAPAPTVTKSIEVKLINTQTVFVTPGATNTFSVRPPAMPAVQSVTFTANGQPLTTTLLNGTYSATYQTNTPGVYLVRAVVTTSGSTYSGETTAVVMESPNVTAPAIPGNSSAGATAGSFAVSDMGAAGYSIPIALPPGIGGMQPGLALSYSSQGGNGHVGVGWSLSGLSAITRCPATIAQEGRKEGINYDEAINNDLYCLDGQKLIPIGSPRTATTSDGKTIQVLEYRTEIDSFSKIEGYQMNADADIIGIRNFKVWTKSGQIMEFSNRWWVLNVGYEQNTIDPNRWNSVRTWVLDKVSDRYGNYYVVDYAGIKPGVGRSTPFQASRGVQPVGAFPPGEHYPTQITYTLNDTAGTAVSQVNRAVFEYEDRPTTDRHVLFDSGAGQFVISKRLKTIKVYLDGALPPVLPANPTQAQRAAYPAYCDAATPCGALVRTYTLNYAQSGTGRSLLTSVVECAADGVCLPATSFDWSAAQFQLQGSESARYTADGSAFLEFQVADIDGDGRSDLVRRYGGGAGVVRTLLSRANGWEDRTLDASNGGGVLQAGTGDWWFGDINGDGKADFIAFTQDHQLKVCITNSTATAVTCNLYTSITRPHLDFFLQGDFNGDGKIDFLLYRGAAPGAVNNGIFSQKWDLHWGTATGINATPKVVYTNAFPYIIGDVATSIAVGDFNGDGRADIITRVKNLDCNFGVQAGTEGEPCTEPDVSWFVNFSRGDLENANVFELVSSPKPVVGVNGKVDRIVFYDFNGDGIADMLAPAAADGKHGSVNLCLSAGDGSFASNIQGTNNYPGYTPGSLCKTLTLGYPFDQRLKKDIAFGDFDGDGRTDMMTYESNGYYRVCLARVDGDPAPPNSARNLVTFECSLWDSRYGPSVNDNVKDHVELLRFGDFNGDGRTDMTAGGSGWVIKSTAGAIGQPVLPDLMTRITNGLTAYTRLEYAPITDNAVYTKGTSAISENQVHIQSPMYVVKKTLSSNGQGGEFETRYKYESLIGHTDGRGLMGFAKKSVEHENGAATVRTDTEYEQVWWKAGRTKSVRKYVDSSSFAGGTLLNEAVNSYECRSGTFATCADPANPALVTGTARLRQVYLTNTVEKSWNLTSAGVAQALPYTVTTTPLSSIDQFGNVQSVTTATYEPNGTPDGYSKVTTSVFTNDMTRWILGRVMSASVTHNAPGQTAITRNSSFTYYAATGQLQSESVEPNNSDMSLRLIKDHTYDIYGNGKRVTSTFWENGSQKVRFVDTFFTTDGRFVDRVVNQYNHTENRTYDRRFGAVQTSTDPNGIRSEMSYDGFGRKVATLVRSVNASNALLGWSTTAYGAQTAGFTVTSLSHTGGQSRSQHDSLGRETSSESNTFSGTWATVTTVYDAFGRKTSVSAPKGGTTTSATATDTTLTSTYFYDKLARVIREEVRGTAITTDTTTAYDVVSDGGARMETTVTQTGALYAGVVDNHTVKKRTDSQGRTTKIIDNAQGTTSYSYDALGNLTNVVLRNGTGNLTGVNETITYDLRGRKKTSTNLNVGGSYLYDYNGAGELISQQDPKGQITALTYDDLGRMKTRTEGGSNGFTTTWGYDCANAAGKQCSVTNAGGGTLPNLPAGTGGATHTTVFDVHSRPFKTTSVIDGQVFERHTLYNGLGQVSVVAYPHTAFTVGANNVVHQGHSVRYTYNARGYTTSVEDARTGYKYSEIVARYSDGSLARSTLAGLLMEKEFDPLGRLRRAQLNTAAQVALQKGNYTYDMLGNVLTRQHITSNTPQDFTESFCYDTLNRVTSTYGGINPTCATAQFTYSADGNLLSKGAAAGQTGAVGAMTYGNGSGARDATTGAGPHAVRLAQGNTYFYDANGNHTELRNGSNAVIRSISYTPFNLPSVMTGTNPDISGINAAAGNSMSYDYDGDHTRVKEVTVNAQGTTTTLFVGPGYFERVINPDNSVEYRHYLPGLDGTAGVLTRRVDNAGAAINTTRYWFKDHLGSPIAEFDANATSAATANFTLLGFDTWGMRRKVNQANVNTFTGSLAQAELDAYASPRGFTGHQHLDELGLIHMNGRIYDPLIGRFLQADPIIQEPYNSQNFNRYTYVLNNPLAYTDPSGYSFWTEIRRPVMAIAVAIITQGAVNAWLSGTETFASELAMGALDGGAAVAQSTINAYASVAGGFAAGGVAGGNLESAVMGAFSAAAFFGVGEALGHTDGGMFQGNHAARIVAHATVGCVSSGVQGGSCGKGAASAGFAAFAGPLIETGTFAGDLAGHAVAGGIGSRVAGGKFANGALTGAFGYLFNACGDGSCLNEKTGKQTSCGGACTPEMEWGNSYGTHEGDVAAMQAMGVLITPVLGPAGRAGVAGFRSWLDSRSIPEHAKNVLEHIESTGGAAPKGYQGGRTFKNDGRGNGQILPKTDSKGNPTAYKEYDVHPYTKGVNRGAERIVRGSDGKAYYTPDHYRSFRPMN
jgi:RHS repeat-associated protein